MNMQSHLVFCAARLLSVKYAHGDHNWKDWKFEELKGLHANETNTLVFSFEIPLCFFVRDSLNIILCSLSMSSTILLQTARVLRKSKRRTLEWKQQQFFLYINKISCPAALLSLGAEKKNTHQNLKASAGWEDDFHLWSSINGSVNRGGGCVWKGWKRNSQQHWILLWSINKTGMINNHAEYRYGSRQAHKCTHLQHMCSYNYFSCVALRNYNFQRWLYCCTTVM